MTWKSFVVIAVNYLSLHTLISCHTIFQYLNDIYIFVGFLHFNFMPEQTTMGMGDAGWGMGDAGWVVA